MYLNKPLGNTDLKPSPAAFEFVSSSPSVNSYPAPFTRACPHGRPDSSFSSTSAVSQICVLDRAVIVVLRTRRRSTMAPNRATDTRQ